MLSEIIDHAILKKARAVATESDHPLSAFFHVLPSRRSFVPVAIIMLIHIAVNRLNYSYCGYIWDSLAFCCDHPIYCRSWVVQCISFLRTIKWLIELEFSMLQTFDFRCVNKWSRCNYTGEGAIVSSSHGFDHFSPLCGATVRCRSHWEHNVPVCNRLRVQNFEAS